MSLDILKKKGQLSFKLGGKNLLLTTHDYPRCQIEEKVSADPEITKQLKEMGIVTTWSVTYGLIYGFLQTEEDVISFLKQVK